MPLVVMGGSAVTIPPAKTPHYQQRVKGLKANAKGPYRLGRGDSAYSAGEFRAVHPASSACPLGVIPRSHGGDSAWTTSALHRVIHSHLDRLGAYFSLYGTGGGDGRRIKPPVTFLTRACG